MPKASPSADNTHPDATLSSASALTGSPPTRVVLVSPSALARFAVERRLDGVDVEVTSTSNPEGLELDRYDVVIMGPYVDPDQRARVADVLLRPGAADIATVVELDDRPDPDNARVVSLGSSRTKMLADAVVALLQTPDEGVAVRRG